MIHGHFNGCCSHVTWTSAHRPAATMPCWIVSGQPLGSARLASWYEFELSTSHHPLR